MSIQDEKGRSLLALRKTKETILSTDDKIYKSMKNQWKTNEKAMKIHDF